VKAPFPKACVNLFVKCISASFVFTVSFLCFNSGDAGAYFAYYQSDCKYTKIFYSWYYRLKKSFCQQKKRLEKPFL
jgi:hypothetical protein